LSGVSRVRAGVPVRLALLALLLAAACNTPAPAGAPGVQHVVLVSLHDPADAAALAAECRERLSRIPGVLRCVVGSPLDLGRSGVDGDYDVGLLIEFAGADGYRAYLAHPEHEALVAAWKPRWARLRIHDFAPPAP
jgi:hypothetical protein